MMKAAERKWYVVRPKPGASRQAKERIVVPDWRREENEAERELRAAVQRHGGRLPAR